MEDLPKIGEFAQILQSLVHTLIFPPGFSVAHRLVL